MGRRRSERLRGHSDAYPVRAVMATRTVSYATNERALRSSCLLGWGSVELLLVPLCVFRHLLLLVLFFVFLATFVSHGYSF